LAARIVGFRERPGPTAHRRLVDWVWSYFGGDQETHELHRPTAAPVTADAAFRALTTGKPPLYFQHNGHSRTIVGIKRQYQADRELGTWLLLFDPAVPGAVLQRLLQGRPSGGTWQSTVECSLRDLVKPEFELLVVEGDRLALEGTPETSPCVSSNAQLFDHGVSHQADGDSHTHFQAHT